MDIDATLALSRFWGLFYLIFGGLFVVTRQLGKTIEMADDKKFIVATGYSTLLMGLMTVSVHNIWALDSRLLVTLLGWAAILKGIHKIGFPESIQARAQTFESRQVISAVLLLLLGLWLCLTGFGIVSL
ncbi:MAG: hypothetical protein P1U64_07360 [Alcanivoracaceae bacterium]|nr:hypothetical protein [Alcanivoracaceae bacterium]